MQNWQRSLPARRSGSARWPDADKASTVLVDGWAEKVTGGLCARFSRNADQRISYVTPFLPFFWTISRFRPRRSGQGPAGHLDLIGARRTQSFGLSAP